MIKVKDGYAKLIGTTYSGSADRVLLSNGGDKAVSDFAAASALGDYVTLATAQTITGAKTFNAGITVKGTSVYPLVVDSTNTSENGIRIQMSGVNKAWLGYTPGTGAYLYNYTGPHKIGINDSGVGFIDSNTILHSGNYTTYTVKKDGTGATGTWDINITGSSASTTNAKYLVSVSPETGAKFWYYMGQPTLANSYDGSSSDYSIYSYPKEGTYASSSNVNIQNLRLQWSTAYFHDIFASPNARYLWHRDVSNASAHAWARIVEEDCADYSRTWNIRTAQVSCVAAATDRNRPLVGTNLNNELFYTTKATINWSTGIITAPKFDGTATRAQYLETQYKDNTNWYGDSYKAYLKWETNTIAKLIIDGYSTKVDYSVNSDSAAYADRLGKTWKEDINYSCGSGSNLKIISNNTGTAGNFASGWQSGISVISDYVGWQLTSYGGGEQNPYFRSLQDNGVWKPWKKLAFISDIPTSLPANGGNADTVDNLHASDLFRAYGTLGTGNSYDSDWGQSIVTFDPVVKGTYPESNPNVTILNLGNNYGRRKQLAFNYNNNNIYFRRRLDSSWQPWVRLALASEIPSVTNYYWANVKISDQSSTSTSPTFANATTTGLLTVSTGGSHCGIKAGSTYINSINSDLILQNNGAIRFGTDSWDYNCWAGLKYVHSSKTISLGLADGTHFTANAAQSGGTMQFPGIGTFRLNGTVHINPPSGSYVEGIRIHPSSAGWTALVFCGDDNTADSGTSAKTWGLFTNGGNFYINKNNSSTTTGYELCNVSGNWGIGTTSPSEKLSVNGSIYTMQPSSNRRAGIIGTYDPNRAAAIWSMGSSYQIAADGTTLGNLYGAAYVYYGSGYTFGAGKSNGHSFVWCQNGTPYVALGNDIWTRGNLTVESSQTLYGLTSTCNAGNDASYTKAAMQIREYNFGGSQSDTWGNAPRLAWHWSGRVQAQIGLSSDNHLYISEDGNFSSPYLIMHGGNSSITNYNVKIGGTTKQFVRDWGHGASDMNGVATAGRSSMGMASLSTPSGGTATAVNPGGATDWHHFINIAYTDGGGGSNSWITQIANKAGTTDLWVRSRSGGTINNTIDWTAPWTRILTGSNYTSVLNGVYLPTTQVSKEQASNDDWIKTHALATLRGHVHNTSSLEWQYLFGISSSKAYGSILRTTYGNGYPRLQVMGLNNGSWTGWREAEMEKIATASPTPTSVGWYRCAHITTSNATNAGCVLISLQRSYNSPKNEHYIFAISIGYNGQVNISQLSGCIGGQRISKVRVVWNNSGNCYFDYYMETSNYTNGYRVRILSGDCISYQSPTLVSEAGGSVTEFSTVNGMKSNYGFTGDLYGKASNVTVNDSDANSTYRMVWHSGNTLYGTGGIYCNPSTDSIYATHFYETSDINLKKNIKAILDSDNIPVIKEFDWKSDGTHSYGLIAQELEEQGYSELVSDSGSHKTVNYSAALSLIVGKLQNKIKELEAEIENLKLRA